MRFIYAVVAAGVVAGCGEQAKKADTSSAPMDSAVAAMQSAAAAPMPPTTTVHGGATIPGTSLRLSYVGTSAGDLVLLDSVGMARGTALASLKVPPLARDERLFMASCDADGKLDPYVVAIVVDEPNAKMFTKIRQAWRANPARPKFNLIPVSNISCEDPGG